MKEELSNALEAADFETFYNLAIKLAAAYWASDRWRNTSEDERDAARARYTTNLAKSIGAGKIDPGQNVFGYLTTMARNALLVEIRTRRRRRIREHRYVDQERQERHHRRPGARHRLAAMPALIGEHTPTLDLNGVWLPAAVMERADLSPGAKLLYALLLKTSGPITLAEMAQTMRASWSSMVRWRDQLEELGLIARHSEANQGCVYRAAGGRDGR